MHYTKRRQLNRPAAKQNSDSQAKPACQHSQHNPNNQDQQIHITLSINTQGKVSLKQHTHKNTPALSHNTKQVHISEVPGWLKKKTQNNIKNEAKPRTPTSQKTDSSVPRWLTLKPANTPQQTKKKTPGAPVVFVPKMNKSYDKKTKPTQAILLTAPAVRTTPNAVGTKTKKEIKKPAECTKRSLIKTIQGKISSCINLFKGKR
jgi:hypothetical protein